MDDSVLLNMIYEIYVETFPQKRKQSRQRKKRVKLSSEQLYHEFRSLKEFCRKIEKIEITLWALQELTQNLETSLNYKLEKRAKFIDNVSRIVIFFITGIAIVFAWWIYINILDTFFESLFSKRIHSRECVIVSA